MGGAITGTSATDVWFARTSHAHFDGTSWTTSAQIGTDVLEAAWAAGPKDVWAGGNVFEHFDDRALVIVRHDEPLLGEGTVLDHRRIEEKRFNHGDHGDHGA